MADKPAKGEAAKPTTDCGCGCVPAKPRSRGARLGERAPFPQSLRSRPHIPSLHQSPRSPPRAAERATLSRVSAGVWSNQGPTGTLSRMRDKGAAT